MFNLLFNNKLIFIIITIIIIIIIKTFIMSIFTIIMNDIHSECYTFYCCKTK